MDARCDGARSICTAVIDAGGIGFHAVDAPFGVSDVPVRVNVSPTTTIRARPTHIEIAESDDRIGLGAPYFADRERLRWELGVRWPAAFRPEDGNAASIGS